MLCIPLDICIPTYTTIMYIFSLDYFELYVCPAKIKILLCKSYCILRTHTLAYEYTGWFQKNMPCVPCFRLHPVPEFN